MALTTRFPYAKLAAKQDQFPEDTQMLRAEDNKFLTQSGEGTPISELLRLFGDATGYVGRSRIAAAE